MPDDVLSTVPKSSAFSSACAVQAWVERCLNVWQPQKDDYYYPDALSEAHLTMAARYVTEKNQLRRWWIGWWHDGKHHLKSAYQWQLIYGLQGHTQAANALAKALADAMKPFTASQNPAAQTVPSPIQILHWRQFACFRSPMPLWGVFSKKLSDQLRPLIQLSQLMQLREQLPPPTDWQRRIDFERDQIDGQPIEKVAERVSAYQRRGWFGRWWMRWWKDRGIQSLQRLYFYYQAQWTKTMLRHAPSSSNAQDNAATTPVAYKAVETLLKQHYPQEKRSISRVAHQVASLPELAMDAEFPVLFPNQMRKAQVATSQGVLRHWQAFQVHALGHWQRATRQCWSGLMNFFTHDHFDWSEHDAQWRQVRQTLQRVEHDLGNKHHSLQPLIQATALAYLHQLIQLQTRLEEGHTLVQEVHQAHQLWKTLESSQKVLAHLRYFMALFDRCRAYPETLLVPGSQLFQSAYEYLAPWFDSFIAESESQAMLTVQRTKLLQALLDEMNTLGDEFNADGQRWTSWPVTTESMATLEHRLETLEQGSLSQRYAHVEWTIQYLDQPSTPADEKTVNIALEKLTPADEETVNIALEKLKLSRHNWQAQHVRAIGNEIEALDLQLKADTQNNAVDEVALKQRRFQISMKQWQVWMRFYQRYELLQKLLKKVRATSSQNVLDAIAMWEEKLIDSLEYWLDAHRIRIIRDTQQLTDHWVKQNRTFAQLIESQKEEHLDNDLLDKLPNGFSGAYKLQNILSEEIYQRYEGLRRLLQQMARAQNLNDRYPDLAIGKARAKEVLESQFKVWFAPRRSIIEKKLAGFAEVVPRLNKPRVLEEYLESQEQHRRCVIDTSRRWLEFSQDHRDLRAVLQRMRVCFSQVEAQAYITRLDAIWQDALNQKSQPIASSMQTFETRLAEIERLARQDWFEGQTSWAKTRWLMWQAESQQHHAHLHQTLTLLENECLPGQPNDQVVKLKQRLAQVWQRGCETQRLWEALWKQEETWRELWEAHKQCGELRHEEDKKAAEKQDLAECIKTLLSSEPTSSQERQDSFVKALLMDFESRLTKINDAQTTSNERSLVPYMPNMQSNTLIYALEVFDQVGQGHLFQYTIFCAIASLRTTVDEQADFSHRVQSIVEVVQQRYEKPYRTLHKEIIQLMGKLHPDRDPDMLPSFSRPAGHDIVNTADIPELKQAVEAAIWAEYQAVTEEERKHRSSQLQALKLRLTHLCATRAYNKGGLLHPREATEYIRLVDVQNKLDGLTSPVEQQDIESLAKDYETGELKRKLEQIPIEKMSLAEYVALMWVDPKCYETHWMRCLDACQYHQTKAKRTELLTQVFHDTFREHATCQDKVENFHSNTLLAQKDAEIARLKKLIAEFEDALQVQEHSEIKRDNNTTPTPMRLFGDGKNSHSNPQEDNKHAHSTTSSVYGR